MTHPPECLLNLSLICPYDNAWKILSYKPAYLSCIHPGWSNFILCGPNDLCTHSRNLVWTFKSGNSYWFSYSFRVGLCWQRKTAIENDIHSSLGFNAFLLLSSWLPWFFYSFDSGSTVHADQGDMYYSSHFPMLKYKFYNSMLSLPSLKYKYCLAHLYTLCLSSRESQPFFLVPSNHSHATHVSIIKTSLYRQWSSTRGLNFPGKMFQNPKEAGKDT